MSEKLSYFPALADANTPLSEKQLEILRSQVVSEGDDASVQSRFNYAWGLIKSNEKIDQRLGITILTEIFKSSPNRRRECLYYLTIGTFKLGDYSDARRYAEALLAHEPDNQQAQALKKLVDDKVAKEGLIGIAVAGGLLALGVGAVGALMRRKR